MERIIINNIQTKYLVSEDGKVYSEYKKCFLKPSITQHGYCRVTLSVSGKKVGRYIHRLVAEYFLGFQEKTKMVINHIDGNKQNNNVANLEIITPSENLIHAYKNGLKNKNYQKTQKFEEIAGERWKEIPGFNGDYEISDYGRVKSNKYNSPIILRCDTRCGYYSVTLSKEGKTKHFLIHDLVYNAFLGTKRLDNFIIDHIDGNKLNNKWDNLRCISKSENTIAAFYEQGLSGSCKPVIAYKSGKEVGKYPSIAKASEILHLDSSSISKVCKNKQKTIHGYTFKYLEEGSTVIL